MGDTDLDFVEKSLDGSRKRLFNKLDRTSIISSHPQHRVIQSETLREFDETSDLESNQ